MFLDPRVAGVGMNEVDLRRKRIPYRVAVYSFDLARTRRLASPIYFAFMMLVRLYGPGGRRWHVLLPRDGRWDS
jgi:hypothetical protein